MAKTKKSIICIFLSIVLIFSIGVVNQNVYAKSKVDKVMSNIIYGKNSSAYMIVKGVTANKHTIWTFKTQKAIVKQGGPFKCVAKKNRVYVFDNKKLHILNKNTGKRIYLVKNLPELGHFACITNSYNCYVIGNFGENSNILYKISPKGKILWKSKKISDKNYVWPSNVRVKGKKVIVKCSYLGDGAPKDAKLYFNSNDGKMSVKKKQVSYVTTKKEYKIDGQVIMKIDLKRPVLSGKSKAAKKINNYFKNLQNRKKKNIWEHAKIVYKMKKDNNMSFWGPARYESKILLKYDKDNKYSFEETEYDYYLDNAHGEPFDNGYNFKKSNGQKLTNSKLTKYSNSKLKEKIYLATKKKVQSNPEKYFWDAIDYVKKTKLNKFNCYLFGTNLYVVYNPNIIAPFSTGITTVKVKL